MTYGIIELVEGRGHFSFANKQPLFVECPRPSTRQWQTQIAAFCFGENVDIESVRTVWRKARAKYRKAHPEKIREERKKYKENHLEKIRAEKRRYKKNHPEIVKAQRKRYKENHP